MILDHVNIRATDLDAMADFFATVAELNIGDRPPFAFDGRWLYDETENPVVHLIQWKEEHTHPGPVDHFAFRGTNLDATRERLGDHDIAFVERIVPGRGTVQLFIKGPDQITVELGFPTADAG